MNAPTSMGARPPHLLDFQDWTPERLGAILDNADTMLQVLDRPVKKVPALQGLTVCNAFFENSTRTRTSFELAARRMSADVLTFAAGASSVSKGESLRDTLEVLTSYKVDAYIVRHHAAGAAHLVARYSGKPVINAGDGRRAHPTQALLDALTIRRRKGRIEGLTVAICGDILHSRVARSNFQLLAALGAKVRVVAPPTLLPPHVDQLGVDCFTSMDEGLKGVDVVMMLRLQTERMDGAYVPSTREYFRFFGLTEERLRHAADGVLVMHPGPMNRGVEIDGRIADDIARSAVTEQVEMGVAVRMACLDVLTRSRRGVPGWPPVGASL